MPFYRTDMGMVHMRGTRLPRPWAGRIQHPGQAGSVPCMAISTYLCDGQVAHGPGTCDKPLCAAHARQVGRNRHLCPECHQAARQADPQRGLFTSLV